MGTVFRQGGGQASFGGQFPVRVVEFVMEADGSAGSSTDSVSTTNVIKGEIEKVEIKSSTCRSGATVKVYETNSPLTTPDYCVNYTTGATSVSAVYYPRTPCTNSAGNNTTTLISYANGYPYVDKFAVCDTLTCAIGSANDGDDFTVRVYVRG